MQTRFAALKTPSVTYDPSTMFLMRDERDNSALAFLGSWMWTDSAAKPPSVPLLTAPAGADALQRKDVLVHNGLVVNLPRELQDIYFDSRQLIVTAIRREQQLRGKGYNQVAIVDALQAEAAKWTSAISTSTKAVMVIRDRLDSEYTAASERFPDTDDDPQVSAVYDVALLAKNCALTTQEEAILAQSGTLPGRFTDARLVQALWRAPRGLHALSDAQMQAIRDSYARAAAPHTVAAVELLRQMVLANRQVLASAVLEVARLRSITPDVGFAAVEGGEWLAEVRSDTGISQGELQRRTRDALDYAASQGAAK